MSTIYRCDKCGAESPDRYDKFNATTEVYEGRITMRDRITITCVDLCDNCMIEVAKQIRHWLKWDLK